MDVVEYFGIFLLIIVLSELAVRVIETKTPDGFLKRVGCFIDRVLRHFPNRLK